MGRNEVLQYIYVHIMSNLQVLHLKVGHRVIPVCPTFEKKPYGFVLKFDPWDSDLHIIRLREKTLYILH